MTTDPLTPENLRLIASGYYSLGQFEDDPGAITDLLLACADRIEADAALLLESLTYAQDRVAALTAERDALRAAVEREATADD